MRARNVVAAATTAGVAAALITATAPSSVAAGATVPHLVGSAAGSTVTALGGAVTSGPTAQSGLDTLSAGRTSSNTIAAATVAGVASTGAVSTSTTSSAVTHGLSLTSHARTLGLNLLGGAVTAKAVDTVATATVAGSKVSESVHTSFVDLRIGGLPVTATVGRNTTLTVPGVATVTLNRTTVKTGPGAVQVSAAGAVITLLDTSALGGRAASVVTLNPVSADITQVGPSYAPLSGDAYATRIVAFVGRQVAVTSGPTGRTLMATTGTGGQDVTNHTVAVNLPGVATVGAVGSTANGIVGNTLSRSTMSARIADVNLLGGAITADTLAASASVKLAGRSLTRTGSSTLLGLVIAGRKIPVNTKPNTVIAIPGLARVVVNAQTHTATSSTVHALDITLTTAAFGLPAGVVIEVGAASAGLLP